MGLDENGLGASLGPLVVTAVVAEVSERGHQRIDRWRRAAKSSLLDDSKRLIRHGDVKLGEAWARVLTHEFALDPKGLLESISSLPQRQLTARCPRAARGQCWSHAHERFSADAALMQRVRAEARRLEALGVRPHLVRSRLVCTDELNERAQSQENRFLVDLHSMEELIVGVHAQLCQPLTVVCGKVGGMHDYTRHFGELGRHAPTALRETKRVSSYRFADLGDVKFVRDADGSDPLVMLASLVGKYLRELFVSRIGDYFSDRVIQIRKPSGYHDSVTRDFVEATREFRRHTAFPASCFERTGPRED
jgi:ribonuclease HII